VILDLDGTGGRGRTRRHLSWILPLAAAAVALALVAAVNAVPHETTTREAAATPRVDTLSRATPVPKLNLTLPQDLAVLTARAQYTGETGLLRPDAVVVTYRLRAGGDLVTVSPLPDAPAVRAPRNRPLDSLSVHGNFAEAWTTEATSTGIIRWTENGTTYQMSSRTLRPPQLVQVAEQLR